MYKKEGTRNKILGQVFCDESGNGRRNPLYNKTRSN